MFTIEHFLYCVFILIGGFITLKFFGAIISTIVIVGIILLAIVVFAYRKNGGNIPNTYEWLKGKVTSIRSYFGKK